MPCINSPAGLKLPGYASRLPPLVPYGTLYKKERRRSSVTSPVCIPNKPLIGSKPIRASIGHANMLMQSNKPCMPPQSRCCHHDATGSSFMVTVAVSATGTKQQDFSQGRDCPASGTVAVARPTKPSGTGAQSGHKRQHPEHSD